MNKVLSRSTTKSILYASLLPILTLGASAQTATWQQVNAGMHSWQDPLNWNTGVVPNGIAAAASFSYNPFGAQIIGLDENVMLGTLSFGNSKGSYTLAGSLADTLMLYNDALGATVSNLGVASNVIGVNLDLVDDSHTFHIADGRLTLDGVISGSNGFIKTGNGWLVLRRTNTYTGDSILQGGITLVSQPNNDNAVLGATGAGNGTIIQAGATLAFVNDGTDINSTTTGGASLNTEAVSVGGTGHLNLGAIRNYAGREQNQLTGVVTATSDTRFQSQAGTLAFTSTVNLGGNNLRIGGSGFVSLTGAVQGSGTITHFGISGFRLQNTTGSNTFSGAIVSELGELRAENSDGTTGVNPYSNVSSLSIKNGLIQMLANASALTVQNRLDDDLPITLQAGRIRIENASFNGTNTIPWAETLGPVTSTLGHTFFDFRDTSAVTGTRVLTVSSLTRSNDSVTFQLSGDGNVLANIGAIVAGDGSVVRYRFFNSALDGGGNVPFVGGWAYSNKEFLKYNDQNLGGHGYRALEASDYFIDQAEATWDASRNVKITSANRNLTLNTTVKSLNILSTTARTLAGNAGTTLVVDSGGIITSDATHVISVPTITAGAGGNYHLYDIAWSTNLFRSVVADNGANPVSFVKAGGGTTSFYSANTYTGTTYINEGFFRDVIGARNTMALGSGNLTFAGSPTNQATYETDRHFTRSLGTGVGQVQFLSGTGVGFSAFGAPVNVDFGGAADTLVWGSTHFNPGIFTLNGGNATHAVTLLNPVDLNNEQRYIRLDGSASGGNRAAIGLITNDIYNGGIVKRGGGVLVFDNAKTYTQATIINEGELWLRGQGTAGANVVGNDIVIGQAARLKLDGPWNIGSRQLVSMFNNDDNSASAIAFGPGYGDGSGIRFHTFLSETNAGGQLGAYDFYIQNQQSGNDRRNRIAVQISGLHNFSADVMNQIVNVAPDVEAWFGADTGNGTFTGASLPATGRTKTGGNSFFRLGSGGGTITLANGNVLDGGFPLVVGAEDNTARTNIGGVVYLPQAQNYTGTVTQTVGTALTAGNLIGSGGVLVVGRNGALNGADNNISLRGGEIRFGLDAANSFLGGVDSQYAARNVFVKSANAVVRTIPITGGSNGILQLNELTMRMDDADRVLTVSTIGTHYTQTVFNGPVTLENGATARSAFFDVGTDNSFQSGIGLLVFNNVLSQTGAGAVTVQKRNGGVLVFKADNTYTGPTTVQQGRLVLAHTGAAGTPGSTINMSNNNDRRADVEFLLDGAGPFTVNNVINTNGGNDGSTRVIRVGSLDGSTSNQEVRLTSIVSNAGGAATTGNAASALYFDATHGYRLTVTGSTTLTRTLTDFRTRGALVTLEGVVSGAGALHKYEQGTLVLAGSNTYTGATNIYNGYVIAASDTAFGNASSAVTFNGGAFAQILASGTRTISRAITNSATASTQTVGGLDAGAKTFSGAITLTRGINVTAVPGGNVSFTGVLSGAGGVNMVGTGTVLLTNANTYTGATTVANGTLAGRAQASGSPFGNNSVFTITNGVLRLENATGGTTNTSTTGALNVSSGNASVIVDNGSSSGTTLTFGSLARTNNATMVLRGATTDLGLAGTEKLAFTSAPAVAKGTIGTWAVIQSSGNAGHYARATGSNITTATYTASGVDLNTAAGASDLLDLGGVGGNLTADRTAYAFRTNASVALNGFQLKLGDAPAGTVGQAGMILNNGADVAGGVVDAGTNVLNIYADDAAVSTLGAAVTNFRNNVDNTLTTRLVKFGPGTLEISSAASTYQGNIQVSQGTLSLTAPNVIPTFANLNAVTGSTVILQPGATVRLNGNNQEFGNLSGSVVVSSVLNTAGVLDLGGATLTVGRQGSSTTFSGQLVGDAGSRLVKIGAGRLTLDNWDASRPNSLGTLEVHQGVVLSYHSDNTWSTPNGFAGGLPATTQVLLRGGEWEAYVVGDNTSNFQFIPMGHSITARDGNAILDTNRWQGSAANKILGFDTLTVDKNLLTITGGNAIYPRFDGAFTMTANARLQTDAPLLLGGTINGHFTLTKTGSSNLEINADNSAWAGGTVLHDGTLLFGSRTPEVAERYMAGTNLFSYSATANLGTGDIVVNRSTAIRLTAPSNVLVAQGQRVQTFSNLQNAGLTRVDLGVDAPLSDYGLRSTTNGALTVGLNDGFFATPLDQSLMGNGRWALGAWATSYYTAAKLGYGIDSIYRFAGTNGVFNIAQANALFGPASLEVGMDMVPNGFAINNGNAQVQLYGDQSYTGNTLIRRNREAGSTQNFLAFHGDLASPVIDVYGRLMARGAGRFTNDAGAQVNTVNLYPGSVLRLDYNMDVNDSMVTSRLENSNLGLAATENKWGDSTPMLLDGATLNMISSSGRVNREAVGPITVRNGAAVLLERNGTNGQIILETPSITRDGQATFAVRENADELGRVDLQSQKFFIDNGASMLDAQGLLPVWMTNPVRNTFLTYSTSLGVQNAAFTNTFTTGDATQAATFLNGLTSTSVATFAGGQGDPTLAGTVNVHAIRIAATADNETTFTGGQINIHSGGLIAVNNNAAGRVNLNTTNVYFGNGTTPVEAVIYSAANNITTRLGGVVTAANLTLHGIGNLNLTNTGNAITGNIQINSGKLFLDGAGTAGNSNVSITLAGDWVQNNDGQQMAELWLRTNNNANASWNNSLVIAPNVPYARIIGGRFTGSATTVALNTVQGSLTIHGTNTLQGTSIVIGSTGTGSSENTYDLAIAGATTIGGTAPVGFRVEQSGRIFYLTGAVSGSAPLIKSGDGILRLEANNTGWSSPVTLNRGEIRGVGNNTNNFFGTGDYTLNFGTLRISQSLGANAFYFNAPNQDIVIGGAVNIVNDRNGGAGRTLFIGADNGTNTVRTVNGAHWRMTSDSSDSVVFESKIFVNDAAVFFTDNAPTFFRDTFEGSGRFTKVGVSQVLFDNNVANSNWTGTIDIQAGYLRVQQANQTLGGTGSSIILHPASGLSVRRVENLGTGDGITQLRTTSRTSATVLSGMIPADFTALRNHYNSLTSIGTGVGILAMSGTQTYTTDPDMANFRDGNWYLGTLHDTATLNVNSLAPWGPGGNKFLIGGGSSSFVLNPVTAGSAQLAGAGNQLILGIPQTYFGYATVTIGSNANNTFDGGTLVTRTRNLDGSYRGMAVSIQGGAVGTGTTFRTPLGTGAVDVFGEIRVEGGSGTLANGVNTNANAWTFHPGTRIRFDNGTPFTGSGTTGTYATGTLGGGGRWGDSVGINLNATVLELYGDDSDHIANREIIGDLNVSRGSEVVIRRRGAFWAELVAGNLTRGTHGTLMITTMVTDTNTAGIIGTGTTNANATRFLIANSGDLVSNNMVAPWIISRLDSQFLKYDATNGFQLITEGSAPANYLSTSTTTLTAGVLGANDGSRIVSLTGSNNFTLGANLDIHALRLERDINVSADGQFNRITIRSGGLTQFGNTPTINPDLYFGLGGTGEALIHASNNTLQINGKIFASQVTKFGTAVLNIRSDQPQFTGSWVINGGGIQFLTPGSASSGEVILNGSRANDRDNTFSLSEVRYNFNSGSPDLFTWNGGKITGYDVNRIYMPTASDRLQQIPAVDLRTTNAVPGTGQEGLMIFLLDGARTTVRTGTVTLHDHYQVQVESNTYGTGSTAGFQFGAGDGTGGLNNQGLYDLRKVGDGVLTLGNNSASFTGGRSITIGEGAVRVLHPGAFGGAGNTGNIEQGGALEIAVAGWSPLATLVQQPGSIERWAVNGARAGNYSLPSGVHLQIMANQTGTRTITLDGGSIMGYLPRDWDHVAVIHQLGSGITLHLASNSFLGQPYASSNNSLWDQSRLYDIGKINQTNASNPNDSGLRGSYLQIHGAITGPGGLTKVGQDIILLNGANTYAGATVVENGILQIGRNNSLPVGTDLRLETSSGMFDLNGYNQEVASLAGDQGSVNNGAFAFNTLTVNQAGSTTYGGTLDGNVSVVKSNSGVLTLTGVSAMRGDLIISGGSVALSGSGSVNESRWISIGAGLSLDVTGRAGGAYDYDGLVSGGGVGVLRADNAGRARVLGSLSLSDSVGTHARNGTLRPGGSSGGAYGTAGDLIGHLQVTGDLSLSGGLHGSTTKTERLTLQLAAPTSTLAALGWDGSSLAAWLTANAAQVLNGEQGDLSGHDYVNVGGAVTLNEHGTVGVALTNSYTPAFGDIFNLLDWTTITANTFNAGPSNRVGGETGYDLNLPDLSAYQLGWNTDLFLSHGVLVVAPEPGRLLLVFLGLAGLCLRRRR